MRDLQELRGALPDAAKDIRLNLDAVLTGESPLTDAQRWGTALASALVAGEPELTAAIEAEARAAAGDDALEDARAAAALMAMNNVLYRFRHQVGREEYSRLPARLRMNRMRQPASNAVDFELFSLAVSAIHGCEVCVQAHERAVMDGGLTPEHVNDAVRIAATVRAAAVALGAGPVRAA